MSDGPTKKTISTRRQEGGIQGRQTVDTHVVHFTSLLFIRWSARDAGEAGEEPLGHDIDRIGGRPIGVQPRLAGDTVES